MAHTFAAHAILLIEFCFSLLINQRVGAYILICSSTAPFALANYVVHVRIVLAQVLHGEEWITRACSTEFL